LWLCEVNVITSEVWGSIPAVEYLETSYISWHNQDATWQNTLNVITKNSNHNCKLIQNKHVTNSWLYPVQNINTNPQFITLLLILYLISKVWQLCYWLTGNC
jgi:hypothetical protein